MVQPLSWLEIDTEAIVHNLKQLGSGLAPGSELMAVVKGNAYGHGTIPVARAALQAGARWLGVFNLGELEQLRAAGIEVPVLVLGYVPRADLARAIALDARLTVSSLETLEALGPLAESQGRDCHLHLKLECGTNRLGFTSEQLPRAVELVRRYRRLVPEGAHTHFANIEDTTVHDYAREQLRRFRNQLDHLRRLGVEVARPHAACTAAAILFPETHFSLVRVGIGMYGLWPSKETYLSARQAGRARLELRPALTWKTMIVQIKQVAAGEYVGYGCSYRTTRPTRLAILPVGYANGYDRLLSNRGHVLVGGRRAPIVGRVCMNLTMVDVTDVPQVELEQEVILLGKQGDEAISAEQLAEWCQTINYEIVTRADPQAPRLPPGKSPGGGRA